MINIIIYIIIILLLISFLLIKLFNRFWSSQPVFHIYNLWYWLFPIGIIQHQIPDKNKYYDLNIDCTTFNDLTAKKKQTIIPFLQSNYYRDKNINQQITRKNLFEYLKNQKNFSYISTQYLGISNKLIACLTSRLLAANLNSKPIFISYMDNLCVHKNYIKSDIGYKQIFTHYLKSREQGSPAIFLFKRNKKLKLQAPLTTFNSYIFKSKPVELPNKHLPNNIICLLIGSYNFQILVDFMQEVQNKFECFIIPPFSVLKNLIKENIIFPFILKDNNKPIAIFFYKKNLFSYKNINIVTLCASYCIEGYKNVFVNSLQNTIVLLKKKYNFGLLNIENTSFNNNLIAKTISKLNYLSTNFNAFYFYNFVYRPLLSKNVFMVI